MRPELAMRAPVSTDLPGETVVLGVSPSGFLTIVETKLYRNPQSRREVLGQILDYCAQLTTWSYADLVDEGFKEGKGIMAGPVRRCMRAPLNAANRATSKRLRRKAPA